jgi:phospholipid/cholesterol/gamma-HCH transport system permease protein
MVGLLESLGQFCHFGLRVLGALPGAFTRPAELCRQLYAVLVGALPLAGIAGLSLGVVVWLHLHGVLKRFNAEEALPQALALAVVLEFAPTGASLIVAGRSGASLAAELGSMKLTEQIDALEVLGLSPLQELVAPRVLACVLALPLLTVFVAFLAIGGSFLAEMLGGTLTALGYWEAAKSELKLGDILPATLKTLLFGYLIGLIGCWFGLQTEGGTESVGRAATRGVVGSIFLVLTANVLVVRAIQFMS